MIYQTKCDTCSGEDCVCCEFYQNDSVSREEIDQIMNWGTECSCGNIEYEGNTGYCEECGEILEIKD